MARGVVEIEGVRVSVPWGGVCERCSCLQSLLSGAVGKDVLSAYCFRVGGPAQTLVYVPVRWEGPDPKESRWVPGYVVERGPGDENCEMI